jgi:hypothetical protein
VREAVREGIAGGCTQGQLSKAIGERWQALEPEAQAAYEAREELQADAARYEEEWGAYKEAQEQAKARSRKPEALFNKVVSVKGRAEELFFVLTYLPDLQWCHLAPLMQGGVYGADKGPDVAGKPKWKLVPEGEAEELDISALLCTVVKTKAMKRTTDADKEEWLVMDEAPKKPKAKPAKLPATAEGEAAPDAPVGGSEDAVAGNDDEEGEGEP